MLNKFVLKTYEFNTIKTNRDHNANAYFFFEIQNINLIKAFVYTQEIDSRKCLISQLYKELKLDSHVNLFLTLFWNKKYPMVNGLSVVC